MPVAKIAGVAAKYGTVVEQFFVNGKSLSPLSRDREGWCGREIIF